MLPNYQDDSVRCQCKHGFTGKPCGRYMSLCLSMEKPQLSYKEAILNRFFFFLAIEPIRCSQLFQNGFNCSGVYAINPDGGKPIQGLLWHDHRRWRLDGSVDLYILNGNLTKTALGLWAESSGLKTIIFPFNSRWWRYVESWPGRLRREHQVRWVHGF